MGIEIINTKILNILLEIVTTTQLSMFINNA